MNLIAIKGWRKKKKKQKKPVLRITNYNPFKNNFNCSQQKILIKTANEKFQLGTKCGGQ